MDNPYLQNQFTLLDANQDGFLDEEELNKPLSQETLDYRKFDKRLTFTDFLMAVLKASEFQIYIKPTF